MHHNILSCLTLSKVDGIWHLNAKILTIAIGRYVFDIDTKTTVYLLKLMTDIESTVLSPAALEVRYVLKAGY